MRKLALVTAAILIAVGAAAAAVMSIAPATPAATVLQPVTISIQELNRQVDTGSLPVQEVVGP
jgi:hypothetical protein